MKKKIFKILTRCCCLAAACCMILAGAAGPLTVHALSPKDKLISSVTVPMDFYYEDGNVLYGELIVDFVPDPVDGSGYDPACSLVRVIALTYDGDLIWQGDWIEVPKFTLDDYVNFANNEFFLFDRYSYAYEKCTSEDFGLSLGSGVRFADLEYCMTNDVKINIYDPADRDLQYAFSGDIDDYSVADGTRYDAVWNGFPAYLCRLADPLESWQLKDCVYDNLALSFTSQGVCTSVDDFALYSSDLPGVTILGGFVNVSDTVTYEGLTIDPGLYFMSFYVEDGDFWYGASGASLSVFSVNPMQSTLDDLGAVGSGIWTGVSGVANIIASNPLLLLTTGFLFIGGCIGIFGRLLSRS